MQCRIHLIPAPAMLEVVSADATEMAFLRANGEGTVINVAVIPGLPEDEVEVSIPVDGYDSHGHRVTTEGGVGNLDLSSVIDQLRSRRSI